MAVTLHSRYYGLGTVTIDGKQSLVARPSPPIVDYPDGILEVILVGGTLNQFAFTYYGREDLWWGIADANPGRFPLDWVPGETLLIPPLRVATRTKGR